MKNLLFLVLLLFVVGCGEIVNQKKGVVIVEKGGEFQIIIDQDFVFFQFIIFVQVFYDVGFLWKVGVINDLLCVNNYVLEIDCILNLGVYLFDLVFCILNNKLQEV